MWKFGSEYDLEEPPNNSGLADVFQNFVSSGIHHFLVNVIHSSSSPSIVLSRGGVGSLSLLLIKTENKQGYFAFAVLFF
jgi:hypothetical protein